MMCLDMYWRLTRYPSQQSRQPAPQITGDLRCEILMSAMALCELDTGLEEVTSQDHIATWYLSRSFHAVLILTSAPQRRA